MVKRISLNSPALDLLTVYSLRHCLIPVRTLTRQRTNTVFVGLTQHSITPVTPSSADFRLGRTGLWGMSVLFSAGSVTILLQVGYWIHFGWDWV